jgi:hypothetical protein
MVNLVCIGGPLDGTVQPVDRQWLEGDMVCFPERLKLRPVTELDLNAPLPQLSIKVHNYMVGRLHFPGPWNTTNKLYYLHSPELDAMDVMLRLLNHYATTRSPRDDAQQP